nr:uncharacterized protein CI109_007251 [Kwoniella shandongensis]KAA5524416.1 hypothetical protein CI109_007251 [Kwoniella shandongensis]
MAISSPNRSAEKTAPQSRSSKAGLVFPVGRVHRKLKQGRYADRIGALAPVFLASVMEYVMAEILELSGNAASDNKRTRIIPRHITLAVQNDEELIRLFKNATIAQGGVLPHIHPELLPKPKTGKKGKKVKTTQSTGTTTTTKKGKGVGQSLEN